MSVVEHGTQDLSESLYSEAIDQVRDLIGALSQETSESKLSEAQDAATKALQDIEQNLHDGIDDLRRNAEWETFTLAFYGETNAGKSTLIECLRILLKESTKVRQRGEFHALQDKLGLNDDDLEGIERQREVLGKQITTLQQDLIAIDTDYEQQAANLDRQIASLQQHVEAKNQAIGRFRRIIHLFRKWPEQIELKGLKTNALQLPKQRAAAIDRIHKKQIEIQQRLDVVDCQYKATLNNFAQLEPFEDGQIIGDGRSDFTRETHGYTFEVDKKSFRILDVPGIEGNEANVSEQIGSAVKRAHAVFYVTGKAAPPQTGEPGRPGTLEKIKAHLGAQTEVWTVFNKRITNPRGLHKFNLISDDEQASVNALDEKMRDQLGDRYQRTLTVSALPAFLAVAECLVPRSSNAVSREKFLNAVPSEELLERSGLTQMCGHLVQNTIKDYKDKIRRSNLNKVGVVIGDVCNEIDRLNRNGFRPLLSDLHEEEVNAGRQLRIALNALKSRLRNRGEQAVGQFESNVRNRIYERIASDVSNDEFKSNLQSIMVGEQEAMQANLTTKLDAEVSVFQQQVASIVERFEKHASDLLASYKSLHETRLAGDFKLTVSIDNGVKVYGLLTSLAGGALLIWNPGGWILMTKPD